jgi:16S rRNA processing protein RimM
LIRDQVSSLAVSFAVKTPDTWVPLAEIARPHGVKGELRLKVFNNDSDVLLEQEEVLVRMPDGAEHEVSVDRARRADQAILMKLFSVDDRDRADELRGALICVRRGDFPPTEEGEFYACDVLGAKVLHHGQELGTVRDLRNYPTVAVLVVRASDGGKDYEVPLVDAIVAEIDLEGEKVTLNTLEGVERA